LRKPRNDALGDSHQPRPTRAERAELDAIASERTCVLSRRTAPRDELIRLALGPDGQVAPDIRARADGRGAWIGVGRAALDAALAKGKLKGALARAFKTQALDIPADLGERIETALRQAALDRLGLEARGGTLLAGGERIEQAARSGQVHLLIHASDAGEDGNRRLDQAWRVGGSEQRGFQRGLVFPAPRTILSMALGRENVVHIALTDAAAARRVANAIARWQAFIDPDAGLDGASVMEFGADGPDSTDELDEGHS
jgi:predicted RNA-binding protein YlxR (DUF448 family)